MESEKERLEEDLDMVLNDIEDYNEDLRQHEYFGKPLPDGFADSEQLETYINTLSNEAQYLQSCLDDYD